MTVTHLKKKLTRRGRRHLEHKEPQLIENDHQMLLLRAHTSGITITGVLQQLAALRRPLARYLDRKRHLLPFEDATPIERVCAKLDASLFVVGANSRKRPDTLTMGRMFDGALLDMFDLRVARWRSMSEFGSWRPAVASKPCLQFIGAKWTSHGDDQRYSRLRSLLLDVFGGARSVEAVRLTGIELVMVFVADERSDDVQWRTYRVTCRAAASDSPQSAPPVSLTECGPHASLRLTRCQLASDDLFRRTLRRPKQLMEKRVKNVTGDKLGSQLGRIHMVSQDLSKLATRKLKGLKSRPSGARQQK